MGIDKKVMEERSARFKNAKPRVIRIYTRKESNEIIAERAASVAALRMQHGTCVGREEEVLSYAGKNSYQQ
jgi:hypothetical protein